MYTRAVIIDYKEIEQIERKGVVVYIRGIFDLLHSGHVEYIQYASKFADTLVVGVISNPDARMSKGPDRPVRDENDRVCLINSFKNVDYTFITPEPAQNKSSTELVFESLKPNIFVHHDEDKDRTNHYRKLARTYGVLFVVDSGKKRLSTTSLIESIRN